MWSSATGLQPRTFQACTIRAVLLCHRDAVVQRIRACVTASVGVALVAEDAHADAALASAHQLGADVLILDLDPRHPDDLRAVRRLAPSLRPRLLLVSSEHEDAVLAFDLGAVDFLTAPVEVARFRQAMARVRSAVALDRLRAYHEDSLARLRDVFTLFEDEVTEREASSSDGATLIELRTGGRTVTLAATTIRWISVDKNDVTVHHDAGTVTARHTLADLVARLDPTRFVRTHRSAVVNVDCVRELRRTHAGDGVATLDDGTEVPVSRIHRRTLERALVHPAGLPGRSARGGRSDGVPVRPLASGIAPPPAVPSRPRDDRAATRRRASTRRSIASGVDAARGPVW